MVQHVRPRREVAVDLRLASDQGDGAGRVDEGLARARPVPAAVLRVLQLRTQLATEGVVAGVHVAEDLLHL